jgi:hypothetical protein
MAPAGSGQAALQAASRRKKLYECNARPTGEPVGLAHFRPGILDQQCMALPNEADGGAGRWFADRAPASA